MLAASRRRGATLIFALGILSLLSVFAISFASLVRLERQASAHALLAVRAKLAARAGVEAGIASLRAMAKPLAPGEQRYCETAFSNPRGPWHYQGVELPWKTGGAGQGLTTGNGIPLEVAVAAARVLDAAGDPPPVGYRALSFEIVAPKGHQASALASLPVSGVLGGTHVPGGDVYALKVLDCHGMINLNHEDTPAFREMLVTLGAEIAKENAAIRTLLKTIKLPATFVLDDHVPDLKGRNPIERSKVDALLAVRAKVKRFTSKTEIAGLGIWTPDELHAIADYVTCQGQAYKMVNMGAGGKPALVHAPASELADTPDFDRYPVNINTAPRPVLVAILTNAKAKAWRAVRDPDATSPVGYGGDAMPYAFVNGKSLVEIACDPTTTTGIKGGVAAPQALADAIIAWRESPAPDRGRFRSWRDVTRCFCEIAANQDDLADPDSYVAKAVTAALVATNPYALSLGWNPDRPLRYWDEDGLLAVDADKASATVNAEISFNTNVYEVEALGRICSSQGTSFVVEAEATARSVVQVGSYVWIHSQNTLDDYLKPRGSRTYDLWPQRFGAGQFPRTIGWLQMGNVQDESSPGGVALKEQTFPIPAADLARGGKRTPDGFFQQRGYGRFGDTHDEEPLVYDLGNDAPPLVPRPVQPGQPANGIVRAEAPAPPGAPAPGGGRDIVDEGTVSFWVKLALDVEEGSNESLFYYVRRFADKTYFRPSPGKTVQDDPDRPESVGCATRLERFGKRLYACRFFWGRGGAKDAASPPTGSNWAKKAFFSFAEQDLKTLGWTRGSWHHVVISWNVMDLRLHLDGKLVPGVYAAEVNANGSGSGGNRSSYNGSNDWTGWDGSSGTGPAAGQAGDGQYQVGGWWAQGFQTDMQGLTFTLDMRPQTFVRMKLSSADLPKDTHRWARLGGYLATPNEEALFKQDTFSLKGSNAVRWSNATFSDFRFAPKAAASATRPARYGFSLGGLHFDLSGRLTENKKSALQRDIIDYLALGGDPNDLAGYVSWFAQFAPSPQDNVLLKCNGQELGRAGPRGKTTYGRDVDRAVNRWGGGVPMRDHFTGIDFDAMVTQDPDQCPVAIAGFSVQFLLPVPLVLERTTIED